MQSISSIPENPKKINRHLSAALVYAKRLNWAVFPLVPKGKNPITKNGYKDASKKQEQIVEWWTKWPAANIGIPTGMVNGFFVVDVDNRNAGHEELESLTDKNGQLPDTVEALTGSVDGSRHILFKQTAPMQKGKLPGYSGIDVQADGAYIVAAPSIHPSGNKYEWELSSHPLEVELSEPPEWLMNLLKEPSTGSDKPKAKPFTEYIRILQGVNDGERNNSLVILIGHLLARNIHYAEAFEIVRMWNESRVNPPLSPDTVTSAFNNIMQQESQKGG